MGFRTRLRIGSKQFLTTAVLCWIAIGLLDVIIMKPQLSRNTWKTVCSYL